MTDHYSARLYKADYDTLLQQHRALEELHRTEIEHLIEQIKQRDAELNRRQGKIDELYIQYVHDGIDLRKK